MLVLDVPAEFWSGTGGALIGSLLSGLVAFVVALFAAGYAARKTSQYDRERDARHAASRFNVAVHDAMTVLIKYSERDYPTKARDAVSSVSRAFLVEAPYITSMELLDQCNEVADWLRDVWTPTMEHVWKHLPDPVQDPETGSTTQDLTALRQVAEPGAHALSNLGAMLAAWQMKDQLLPVRPLPDFEVVTSDGDA